MTKIKRDMFSFPEEDLALLLEIKQICLKHGVQINKSEVVRAGIHALHAMEVDALLRIASEIPKIKTGRKPSESQNSQGGTQPAKRRE